MTLTPAGHGVLSVALPGLALSIGSGQTLLIALSLGAGLLLAANVILAVRALRAVTVHLSPGPTATLGQPVPVPVKLGATGSPVECEVGVIGGVEHWSTAVAPMSGELLVRHTERGVLERLDVRARTSIPLGLTRIERRESVALPVAVVVAPAPLDTILPERTVGSAGAALALRLSAADEVDGLRPYAPGDAQRDVHWRTLARTGNLLVLDRRAPSGPGAVRIAVHGPPGPPLEAALARTRSVAEHLLRAGHHLILTVAPPSVAPPSVAPPAPAVRLPHPAEPGGPVEEVLGAGGDRVLGSELELMQWLAEADAPDAEGAPTGEGTPDLDVTEEGARWRTVS